MAKCKAELSKIYQYGGPLPRNKIQCLGKSASPEAQLISCLDTWESAGSHQMNSSSRTALAEHGKESKAQGNGLVRMNLLCKSPKLTTDRFSEGREDSPFLGGHSYWSGGQEGW